MIERKHFEWKLRTRSLQLGERTLIMAILNVTPDSFSDGGKYLDPDLALARALELEELGADLIDIGAESTRPGAARISEAEELRRLVPVLKRLEGRLRIPVSVDTYKAAVAEKAAEYGAEVINDPSGFSWDTNMAKVVVAARTGFILTHMRGTPDTWAKLGPIKDLIVSVRQDLEAAISRTTRAGVERARIVIDPGIGFGKRKEQNAELIAHLPGFTALNAPLMVGPSRKSFLKRPDERATEFATAAAVAASVMRGAHVIRLHDVGAMKAVIEVTEEIVRAGRVVEKDEVRPSAGHRGQENDPGVNRLHPTSKKPHESLSKRLRPARSGPPPPRRPFGR